MTERLAIGLDLGGTDLKAALVAADGSLQHFSKRPARAAAGEKGPLECMAEAVRELLPHAGEADVVIGIGAPGAIDPATGCLVGRTPHMPHWVDFPLRERAAAALGRAVVVDNDAHCAALAEHVVGAAKGTRVSITVTVGTGVGGGIIIDGQIFRGAWGGAGEFGHLPIGTTDLECACGVPQCAEPEMSGSGLARTTGKPAHELFAEAAAGSTTAQAQVDQLARQLGRAIACAVDIINPEIVVLGGAVFNAGESLLRPVEASIRRYSMPSHGRQLRVALATLEERAGATGAALMAFPTPAPGAR